ncbi:hypothetical protein ABFS83_10G013100 [Erythranthe nasuta]
MRIIFFLVLLSIYSINNLSSLVFGQCLEDQKYLLLGLKSNLIFNSSTSNKLVEWNRSTDCCSWNGVECDAAGHVISLQLDHESISGGIEDSEYLFRLTYLERLNLAFNHFNGTEIPKGIHNLTELTHLNLSTAGFSGQVPFEILGLRKLTSLDLSWGHEPIKLENPDLKMLVQNLTGLKELYLESVDISATGSEWCQVISSSLPDLRILSLRHCYLSGPIDSSLAKLRSLSVLRLNGNNLSSSVPTFFANFSKLTTLTLFNCYLHGSFPQKVFQIPSLQNIDLAGNEFLSGTLPQFPLTGSLRNILLSRTNFSGSLPASIGNLAMLSWLDLSYCRFNGTLPPTIGNLTELDQLDISGNNFTGLIPLFYLSKKLTYIDAARNSLTGSLSSMHFQGLSNLVYISLGNNLLGGNIPSNLFALPSLQSLDLSNNKFDGPIQEVSNPSSSLIIIVLSSNHLEGPIPKFFSQLDRLIELRLSSNFFNGTMQLEMFPPNLSSLELSFNNLSIVLDDSNSSLPLLPQIDTLGLASCKLKSFPPLSRESRLNILDLSSNQLKGQIPNWIWEIGNGSLKLVNLSFNMLDDFQKSYKLPSLDFLDLHSNRIQGELPIPPPYSRYVDFSFNYFNNSIPHDIGNLFPLAIFFSVSNNKLTGEIPASICNASYLQVLDLSANALNGSIPSCLPNKNLDLRVLSLARNNLSGDIPDTFTDNCNLKTLDLENNVFRGKIPGSIVNCSFLEVLNIGNNRIESTFPCMLTKTGLRVLILRSNGFHGELLCFSAVTQKWPNLQIIDISHNNFSGDISVLNFSNWRGMIGSDNSKQYDYLRFDFLKLSEFYYQDAVALTIKGLEMELTKILTIFTSIDFSSNKFYGEIPSSIGDLKSLYLLNLSHNAIMGSIPASVGNLKQLGSLDLSSNNLTGNIPVELASLGFLTFLNLSFNDLFGMIPKGPQFQTFTEASYEGNVGLCGFPVNKSCNDDGVSGASPPKYRNESKKEIGWGYVSAALGFVVGLSSFLWLLLHCKSWGDLYFEKVDLILETLFPHKHGTRNQRRRVIRNRG